MGSWNETCAISNLHICCGDEVVYLVLKNQQEKASGCYVDSFWKPVLLPVFSTYEDYGSIASHEVESAIVEANNIFLGKNNLPNFYTFADDLNEENEISGMRSIMVRRDVWDSLLGMENFSQVPPWKEWPVVEKSCEELLSEINSAAKEWGSAPQGPYCLNMVMVSSEKHPDWINNPVWWNLFEAKSADIEPVLFKDGKLTLLVVKRLAQMCVISAHLDSLRKNWAPTTGKGSQANDFEPQMVFFEKMKNLATKAFFNSTKEPYKYLVSKVLNGETLDAYDQEEWERLSKYDWTEMSNEIKADK